MSPRTILVVAEPFGKAFGAARVAAAVGRGLRAADPTLQADLCPLRESAPCQPEGPAASAAELTELRASLGAADFDARMHRARAVVIVTKCLDRHTLLRRGAVFEVATRARQGGVPCCAVAARNDLDLFELRILDLQVVLEAHDARGATAAGRELGSISLT